MERIRLWYNLYWADIRKTIIVLLPILLLVFLLRNIPFGVNELLARNLDRQVYGVIEALDKKSIIQESAGGGRITTNGLLIQYNYSIEGDTFQKIEFLSKKEVKLERFIALEKSVVGDSILVGYNSRNLAQSRILLSSQL